MMHSARLKLSIPKYVTELYTERVRSMFAVKCVVGLTQCDLLFSHYVHGFYAGVYCEPRKSYRSCDFYRAGLVGQRGAASHPLC